MEEPPKLVPGLDGSGGDSCFLYERKNSEDNNEDHLIYEKQKYLKHLPLVMD